MPHALKDCFGTVIASLKKMKECVRCELLRECRAINWAAQENDEPAVVVRRAPGAGGSGALPAASGDPAGSRGPSGAGAPSS